MKQKNSINFNRRIILKYYKQKKEKLMQKSKNKNKKRSLDRIDFTGR